MPELSAVGIDLGTTYSAIAIFDAQGSPEIVPNSDTERLTPSAVFFDEDAIVVGQTAKDNAATYPDQVVQFVCHSASIGRSRGRSRRRSRAWSLVWRRSSPTTPSAPSFRQCRHPARLSGLG
jgi:molecular chaperone DnaK (HSP70)